MNTLYFGEALEETGQAEAAPKKASQQYEVQKQIKKHSDELNHQSAIFLRSMSQNLSYVKNQNSALKQIDKCSNDWDAK